MIPVIKNAMLSGSILHKGGALHVDYRKRNKDQLRQVQMIYQMADTALNPKHTIRDFIGWPVSFNLGLHGKALEDRVRELLHLIELEPDQYIDRLPSEHSGGQKQRIGIASALAVESRFIICDSPFNCGRSCHHAAWQGY
jgi:peptide/nickel transport system ATP-binding protein